MINVSLVGGTRSLHALSRYPKQLFQEEWNIKPRPGRQRKVWKRVVHDIFESLELDKGEWVESISKGETSIKEFLALVHESIKGKVIGVNF